MKVVIDLKDRDYELLKNAGITIDFNTLFHGKEKDRELTFSTFNLIESLKNGTPYNSTGDLISRSALIEEVQDWVDPFVLTFINNAPTVPLPDFKEGYKQAIIDGKTNFSRPQGEWIKEPNGKTTDIYRCSVCKRSIMLCKGADLANYPFCHCGADMRKGGAE